jgi:hypothetical protein
MNTNESKRVSVRRGEKRRIQFRIDVRAKSNARIVNPKFSQNTVGILF